MPRYKVLRETFLSHAGRVLRVGEEVDIDWPKGCEPKKLGDNLEEVKPNRGKRTGDEPVGGAGSLT